MLLRPRHALGCALVLLISMSAHSLSQTPQGTFAPGDADGDGFVNPFDLDVILAHILNTAAAEGDADTNGDGNIDIADWVKLNGLLFPSDPSALVPAVDLELSAGKVPAGGSLQLNWTVTGIKDLSGVELLLRVREPGTVVSSGDELTFTPGVIPGNGKVYYRTPAEGWTETETVFSPSTTEAAGFTLPSQAEGEWLVEVIARDSATQTVVAIGSGRVIAGDSPTLRLFLNRSLANTNDQVVMTLQTTEGQSPQQVAITALMYLPGEKTVSLPGFNDRITSVYEGPAADAEHLLVSRHFLEPGEGSYRVEVKMYGAGGGLLALGNAGFEVCDSSSEVSGTVKEGGLNPVDGESFVAAQVKAFDLYDSRVSGTSSIGSDGGFMLDLEPSRYLLLALLEGEDSQLLGQVIVTVDCSGEAVETDLEVEQAAQPLGLEVEASSPQAVVQQQAASQIPNPKLFLNLGADDPETAAIAQKYVVEWSNQFPGVDITTDREVAQLAGLSVTQSLIGNESASQETLLDIAGAVGSEFFAPATFSKTGDCTPGSQEMDCQVRIIIPIVDTETAMVIHRIDRTIDIPSGDLADALDEVPTVVGEETPAAQQKIEFEQADPVVPTPTLTLDKEVAEEGETVMATLVTTEIDGTAAGAGHSVRIEHASDTGSFAEMEGTTDAQGSFTATFPVFAGSRAGIVQGFFRRQARQREWESNEEFYTAIPSDSSQSLRVGEPYPPPSLKPGEQAQIRVEVLSTVSGLPIAQLAGIEASAQNGSITPSSGSTDASGTATFTFTAGTDNGLGKATFQRQISGPGVDPTVIQTVWPFAITADAVLNVNTSGGQASGKTSSAGVDPSRAVSVTADLRVGEDRLAGLPVQFMLDGEGEVAVVNAATDPFGLAESFFLPPKEGMGTSTLCGSSVIDGITSTDCVEIEYEPLPVSVTPLGIRSFTTDDSAFVVNKLGQVLVHDLGRNPHLWLPAPAYGLPQGLSQIPLGRGVSFNDLGQVVGWDDDQGDTWVVWENGSVSPIPDLPSKSFAYVFDLNNTGKITGFVYPENGPTHAYLGSLSGGIVPFGQVDDTEEHIGWGVNDQDHVVAEGVYPEPRTLILFDGGGGTTLHQFDEGAYISRAAINNSDQILAFIRTDSESMTLVVQDSQITQLTGLSGQSVDAWDINDDGVIVGDGPAVWESADSPPQNVNDLIPDEIFSETLTTCTAINNENQMVCLNANRNCYLVSGLPVDGMP